MISILPDASAGPSLPLSTSALTQLAITSLATFVTPTPPVEAPQPLVRHLRDEFEEELDSEF